MDFVLEGKRVYVVSDIHNDADAFKRLLKKIAFTTEDVLIIDGDVFDRGENPVDLYFEILWHDNIFCVRGNHDVWVRREIYDRLVGQDIGAYLSYNTFELLSQRMTEADIVNLADWIEKMPCYLNLTLDGRKFQISHAQTYSNPESILDEEKWYMGDDHYRFFLGGYYELEDAVSIVGHTPTPDNRINYSDSGKLIRIDCGNGFRYCDGDGRLGAICLNDGREYYV